MLAETDDPADVMPADQVMQRAPGSRSMSQQLRIEVPVL
jgi:hypothetical protein